MGLKGSPTESDLMMNMNATKDSAVYAAKRLLALDFTGHNVQYLLGKRFDLWPGRRNYRPSDWGNPIFPVLNFFARTKEKE